MVRILIMAEIRVDFFRVRIWIKVRIGIEVWFRIITQNSKTMLKHDKFILNQATTIL